MAKKWAMDYLNKYSDCDKAIEGAKNLVEGNYRELTGREIQKEFLDELEDQLRKELDCL